VSLRTVEAEFSYNGFINSHSFYSRMGKADANRIDSETQGNYSLRALRMEEIVMKKAADFWALAEIMASPLRPVTAGSFITVRQLLTTCFRY
jgi:hypothetical protein